MPSAIADPEPTSVRRDIGVDADFGLSNRPVLLDELDLILTEEAEGSLSKS